MDTVQIPAGDGRRAVPAPPADEQLYLTDRTSVRRERAPDGVGWVIRKESIGAASVRRHRHEQAILERLAGLDGVPRLVTATPGAAGSGPGALVVADDGGVPLAAGPRPLPPDELLDLAVAIADVLAGVHRRGVIHKDLNPTNILRTPDGRPVLIDFDLATTSAEERPRFAPHTAIAGTLAYLAPEQSGRTGRPVDERADLYALGATLYELAVGRPPFGDGEPFRLLHDHLARVPTRPAQENPAVPGALSDVILRLLEKEPDRRYQSAEGLAHDLRLVRQARVDGTPGPVALGERDVPLRLSAPSQLVGREADIAALERAFADARAGRGRVLLVSGAPGVGKSALVDELRAVAAGAGGWFVTGKFDQVRQDREADAVRQAIRGLGRLLLAEPEAALARYRERLLAVLGPNAGLAATIPEMSLVLGVRSAEPTGDAREATARTVRTGVDVLRAVASPERPLVVVLDDLQWASPLAVGFLDALLADDTVEGLLVVGTYRDREVDAAHPLHAVLPRCPRLALTELAPAGVGQLLRVMLRLSPADAHALADLLSARTGGNPYDTIELVNSLRRDGALVPGERGWHGDPATIRGHIGDGDVLDLLSARLRSLPVATTHVVEVLACLGDEVAVDLLAAAAGSPATAVEDDLGPALEEGLLVRDGYREVRFGHDRVREAVHARLDPARRRVLQLAIARALAAVPEHTSTAAEQYLAVVDDLHDPDERRRVVDLLAAGAARATLTNAPRAERLLAAAIDLLVADAGHRGAGDGTGDTLVALRIERHALLYRLRRLAEADDLYRTIAAGCPDPVELAVAACVQVASLGDRGRALDATTLGLEVLARLGSPRPDDLATAVAEGLDRMTAWSGTAEIAETSDADGPGGPDDPDPGRDRVADRRTRARALLLRSIQLPALLCDPLLNVWVAVESQRLWVEEGPCPALLAAMGPAPSLLIGLRGDYAGARALARRVLAAGQAQGYVLETARARVSIACMVEHWYEPVDGIVDATRAAREELLRGGDVQFACLAYTPTIVDTLECALTLGSAAAEIDAALALTDRTGNELAAATYVALRRFVRALRGAPVGETGTGVAAGVPGDTAVAGLTVPDGSFADPSFDETAHRAVPADDPVGTVHVHVYRALSAAIFGDAAALAAHADAAMPLLPVAAGFYVEALARLVRGLALADRARTAATTCADDGRAALLAELDEIRDWLAARALDAPANFEHLSLLLDAERAWAAGDEWTAARTFDTARRTVAARRRPGHRALITERAAAFHQAVGTTYAATQLRAEACDLYEQWGATAKVAALHRAHPELREAHRVASSLGRGATEQLSLASIDLLGVLHASRALSSETNLERLRARVVDVLTGMTGATSVRMLLWNEDTQAWYLPVDAEDGRGPARAMAVDDAGRAGLLPLSVFRYVARTREPLLVPDATRDDRFARDPYLAPLACCSLLVVPVLVQGEPRAVLLLENRLSHGVFTADRLDAVLLVAGQLGVSLDNVLAERFRSLVQRSSDVTLVCDRDGVVTYASSASETLLGWAGVALRGRRVTDLVHPDDRAELHRRVAGADPDADRDPDAGSGSVTGAPAGAPAGAVGSLECRVLTADGGHRWVEVGFNDLFADPAVGGLVLHLRDVTERHRLEQELRHAQKLESVGQLAAGIAHEINTPIQYIGDNVRFLRDAFEEMRGLVVVAGAGEGDAAGASAAAAEADWAFLEKEVPDAIEETLEGVRRVARIVRAMRAFGHPGEGGKAPADMNEAIRNTLVVANSELQPVADVATDLGDLPPVWCNLGDINQVLVNVIMNAAHAVRESADATGNLGRITVRSRLDGDHAVIEVTDTGPGIDPAIAHRIFEPFFTTKAVGVGMGQGLSLAYSLVHDHHGGTITFDSTPGEGTTFTIRLPVAGGRPG